MPAASLTKDQWAEVRKSYAATGNLKRAAELHNAPYLATRSRASREKWPSPHRINAEIESAKKQAVQLTARAAANHAKPIATTVATLATVDSATALETHMREMREEFQTHAATAIRNATKHAATLAPDQALEKSRKLADIVQSGVKLHGLGTPETQVAVQVLNTW